MNSSLFNLRARFPDLALLALAVGALTASVAKAAPTAGGSAPEPTSSAYTNQPTYTSPPPIIENYYSNSNFSSGGFLNSSTYGSNYYYYNRADTFYFPPTPPVLGDSVNRSTSALLRFRSLPSHAVPIEPQLSPYVGEIFYPPLATHLHNEDLTKKQNLQLAAYRQTRNDLLSALHTKIESLQDADAATRERGLAAFAQEQAAGIAAFEQDAEAIREDLIRGKFFQAGVTWEDWDANRSWRLGDDLRYESRVDEFKVIRAAAYFYPYFAPAQRRLLQELALELNEPLTAPSSTIALDAPDAYFYFSPETARTHLPPNLPDDLSAKIATYQKEKAALKEELRAVIYKLDRSFFLFTRRNKLEALIEQQTPRIAALENLAEDIRHALASVPNPSRVRPIKGSNELSSRVGAYMRERTQVLRALNDKVTEAQRLFPIARVETRRLGDAYGITIIPNRRQTKAEDQALAAFQVGLATFNDEQAAKYSALAKAKEKLRTDMLSAAGVTDQAKTNPSGNVDRSVDQMLRKFTSEYRERELWEYYGDYDYAVFEPGLSPGQRRLLFAASLQKLELPIPRGSSQP